MYNQNEMDVPTFPVPKNDARITQLTNHFQKKFQTEPDFFVRVPGRVNLIGEHIDYCGYGVCPMALDQNIILAAKVIPDVNKLNISNVDNKYEDYTCYTNNLNINLEIPKWYNYFLCGVKGIQDRSGVDLGFGLDVAVSGNIPPGSGLSSSSALVCTSVLATAFAKKLHLTKQELADISASCERYIGTQGGGMDQAIAFLANEGCAKYINFSPLRGEDVSLPSGATFVIAHSLTSLNKAATNDFNCRVMECRLATKLLAKKNNLEWEKINTFKQLQDNLKVDLNKMIEIVDLNLHQKPYSKEELCAEFQLSRIEFENLLSFNTKNVNSFKLKPRALHVFQETQRVQKFYEICNSVKSEHVIDDNNNETLTKLGRLMLESHESLQRLYECSHKNLDTIVKLSNDVAMGARLTGAGWGGCTVALVEPNKVDAFIEKLKKEFYDEYNVKDNVDQLVFATSPKGGACIYINK